MKRAVQFLALSILADSKYCCTTQSCALAIHFFGHHACMLQQDGREQSAMLQVRSQASAPLLHCYLLPGPSQMA